MQPAVEQQASLTSDENIELARSLVQHLEQGNEEAISQTIEKLYVARENVLYQEIGKLTRQLHDALGTFRDDTRITSLAENDIPDARERLNYVISKTEESAHRTLTAVENTLPLSDELQNSALEMTNEWERFKRREMNAEDFRQLAKQLGDFLDTVNKNSVSIHQGLSDVMMAQDFQDLTGQIIRKVISIVEEVENSLVNMIKSQVGGVAHEEVGVEGRNIVAEGPQINPTDKSKVVSSQDDVDELLQSLGF